jgi:lantibiotic modifying enzyme
MAPIQKTIMTINELLAQQLPGLKNIGLFNGKMGISIYLFHLAKETGDKEQQKLAEKLIDEVYREVSQNQPPPHFANGLAGIAWGMEYLVQNNFVNANTDEILSDVDDKIYSHIVAQKQDALRSNNIIGYIIYIIARLQGKKLNSADNASTFIFKRLLVDLTNQLGQQIEERKLSLQEPVLFQISWQLPIILMLLAKLKAMNFYVYKIDHLLTNLSPFMLSLFPCSSSNKLYLLLAIERILQQANLPGWKDHAHLLIENIDRNGILKNDLSNKNICFQDGLAGVSFISRWLYALTKDKRILLPKKKIAEKIIHSEYWSLIDHDKAEQKNVGLFAGIAGVGMELLQLSKKQVTAKKVDTVNTLSV